MPTGPCGLCKQIKSLCDSHLIPAAFYKLIQKANVADGASNPNPVVVTPDIAIVASNQVSGHFLCSDCEHLLSVRGEKWMTENCWRSDVDFPLRDALEAAVPVHVSQDAGRVYNAHTAGIDVEKLIHFAASVFWRAAAWQWPPSLGHAPLKLKFGTYEEQMRLFTKGDAPFPKNAALVITVSSNTELGANQSVVFPFLRTPALGSNQFMCSIPGVIFQLFLGNQVSADLKLISITEDPNHFIFLASNDFANKDMVKLLQKAKPKGGIDA